MLVRRVSKESGSVLLKKPASQHIVFFVFIFLKEKNKVPSGSAVISTSGFFGTHFSSRALLINLAHWFVSVALTKKST